MHAGNLARKIKLVDHGFRLPSALDNRPLMVSLVVSLIGAVPRSYYQHIVIVVLYMHKKGRELTAEVAVFDFYQGVRLSRGLFTLYASLGR